MASADNQEQPISSNNDRETQNNTLSRAETIALLNASIDRLEQTIAKIGQNRTLPSSESLNTLSTTTQELVNAVTLVATPETEPERSPEALTEPELIPQTTSPKPKTPSADSKQPTPQPASPKPKTPSPDLKQPVAKQKQRSLSIIAICVAAIAIAIVVIFQIWLPRQETPISSSSVTQPIADEPIIEPTVTDDEPNSLKPIEAPIVEPQQNNIEDTEPTVVEIPQDSESVAEVIPENLESPGKAKDLKVVAIEPELNFTPEQNLIAALKTKIGNLTKKYPPELIELVEVDVPQSSLTVNISDNWYELDESRQTKLASEMLKQSRQLDFAKLKLQDRTGTLVARNPVIGDRIIILQNSKE